MNTDPWRNGSRLTATADGFRDIDGGWISEAFLRRNRTAGADPPIQRNPTFETDDRVLDVALLERGMERLESGPERDAEATLERLRYVDAELVDALAELVESKKLLTPRQRQIMGLRQWGFKQEVVAELVRISQQSVSDVERSARRRLRTGPSSRQVASKLGITPSAARRRVRKLYGYL